MAIYYPWKILTAPREEMANLSLLPDDCHPDIPEISEVDVRQPSGLRHPVVAPETRVGLLSAPDRFNFLLHSPHEEPQDPFMTANEDWIGRIILTRPEVNALDLVQVFLHNKSNNFHFRALTVFCICRYLSAYRRFLEGDAEQPHVHSFLREVTEPLELLAGRLGFYTPRAHRRSYYRAIVHRLSDALFLPTYDHYPMPPQSP